MKERLIEQLSDSWFSELEDEFSKPYMTNLQLFVKSEREKYNVFPEKELTFFAYRATPFNKVKAVILGQDPYHGFGQAHGLAFSVRQGVAVPPSLKNIFKELKDDLNISEPNHGNLTKWTKEGVLLLNTSLTVREATPSSHSKKGWENFTDATIKRLSDTKTGLVFMLWGSHAQSKSYLIDSTKHLVLKAAHPSPFSAYKGFFGCKHFSKANSFLGKNAISWNL